MKRPALALLAVVLMSLASAAIAKEPYSPQRLAELQAADALILIDVFAPWCPTCAKQQEVLRKYSEARPDVELNILVVDFDKDRKYVTALRAPRQSTLILFRGEDQYWFSVAETREDVIFAAIDRAAGL